MPKTVRLLSAVAVLAASITGSSQTNSIDGKTDLKADLQRQSKFTPAKGTALDAKTGLPRRIVHTASGIVLVLIPAGEFQMGTPKGESGYSIQDRQHRRVIRKPFYLGETEVTFGQFSKFVKASGYETDAERGVPEGDNPGRGGFAATADGNRTWTATASWRNPFPNLKDYRRRDDHPVIHVSWNDAQQFCAHFGLQLPSEAQWEYAYRAGSCERFPWGEDEAGARGYGNVVDRAHRNRFANANLWFPFDDGVALIAPVGSYLPNAWMLRDMVGNVQEWCQDAARGYPEDGADESPVPGDKDSSRVMRGGLWLGAPENCLSSARYFFSPHGRRDFIGFRVAMSTGLYAGIN